MLPLNTHVTSPTFGVITIKKNGYFGEDKDSVDGEYYYIAELSIEDGPVILTELD